MRARWERRERCRGEGRGWLGRVLAVGAVGVMVRSFPELVRYLRIRRM